MTDDQKNLFDEPALKAAVKRALGNQHAPQMLRQRVVAAMAGEADGVSGEAQTISLASASVSHVPGPAPVYKATSPAAFRLDMGPLFGLAAAAIVMIAIGGVGLWMQRSAEPVLPPALAAALVERHDQCCRTPDGSLPKHQLPGVPRNDFARIGKALQQRLGQPVLLARLDTGPDGWKFCGAAVCPVDTMPSAHLIFSRGDDRISVLSLPACAMPADATGSESFQLSYEGHSIAGFTDQGCLLCLVESSSTQPMSPRDLQRLLGEHAREIVTATVAARESEESRLTITELIH